MATPHSSSKRLIFLNVMFSIVLLLICGSVQSSPPRRLFQVDYKFTVAELVPAGQPVPVVLTLTRNKYTKVPSFTVRFEPWGGLQFVGEATWQETFDARETYTHELQVILPPGDTCGLTYCFNFGDRDDCNIHSFVPEAGAFRSLAYDIRIVARDELAARLSAQPPAGDSILNLTSDSIRAAQQAQRAADSAESLAAAYEREGYHRLPSGGWARTRKATQAELDLARMRELEQKPCTQRLENFSADNQWYVRYKGEYDFHPAEAHTMEEWGAIARSQQAGQVKDTTTYEILAEVADSAQFQRLRAITRGRLTATDKPNVYRARVNRPSHKLLERFGITSTPPYADPGDSTTRGR